MAGEIAPKERMPERSAVMAAFFMTHLPSEARPGGYPEGASANGAEDEKSRLHAALAPGGTNENDKRHGYGLRT
jgi:hypothetical protein